MQQKYELFWTKKPKTNILNTESIHMCDISGKKDKNKSKSIWRF